MEENEEQSAGNVLVICRFRPLNDKEQEMSEAICIDFDSDHKNLKIISQYEYGDPLKFGFDYIFDMHSRQADVYNISARPIVEAVMQGFNGTVFAYGQTSSGKTYTMTGQNLEDPESMGIIPRMVTTVFDQISNSDACIQYTVKVSYCEIYMEKIRDLLEPSKENLKVHEDKTRGVFIAELTEKYVGSDAEVYDIMKFGLENRNVGSTNMNAVSSRSHSIFLITISQNNERDYVAKTGKLYLIDLAGSEKVGKTNVVGKRLDEAKNINKSLTMLGLVIYSLTDGKSTHIPYRDSKLTRILQDSLGGNSKTSLIITCSPSPYNEAETIGTLRFGMRAKSIKNTPKINREYTVAELKALLAKCREELTKKDRRIKVLEATIIKLGSGLPSPDKNEDDIEQDQEQEKEESKNGAYEELFSVLEDTKNKLAEEVKVSSKLRYELAVNNDELNHNKARAEVFSRQINTMKEKIQQIEKDNKEKDNIIEKLMVTKESNEKDLHIVNTKVIELEAKLNESLIDKQRYEKIAGGSKKAVVEELKELLRREKEGNAAGIKEIMQLRQNLSELLNKKCPDVKITELVKDEISRKERDKWNDERKSLLKDLQTRFDRILELEMALDDSRDSYKILESNMSEGERFLKRKTDTLERNLEQLTIMYHQLITQKSQVQVEKQLADKKLSRVSKTIQTLEDDVTKYKKLNEQIEQKLAICEEELNKSIVCRERKYSANNGNIVKTIQGGNNHARIQSLYSGYNLRNYEEVL